MHFNSQAIYQETLKYYVELAQKPGWKAYVWKEIQDMDNDPSDLYKGIKQDFLTAMENIKNAEIREN